MSSQTGAIPSNPSTNESNKHDASGQTAKQPLSKWVKLSLVVLIMSIALPILVVVMFCVSPKFQNVLIFMHQINFPPPSMVDLKQPMISHLTGLIPALACAHNDRTDGRSSELGSYLSLNQPMPLAGWHIKPEIRCRDDPSIDPSAVRDPNADKCSSVAPLSRPVLYLHGNAENRAYHVTHARYNMLTSWPFCSDVFAFDYRGFGDNFGVPTQDSLIDDVIEMYQYVSRKYQLKSLDIYAHSLGSAVATHALERIYNQSIVNQSIKQSDKLPLITQHLVLEGAFTNIIDTVVTYLPYPLSHNLKIHSFIDNRLSTKLDSIRSLASFASNVSTLLVAGKKDKVIDFWNSERLWQMLVNHSDTTKIEEQHFDGGVMHSAGRHRFIAIEEGDHDTASHSGEAKKRIAKFLYDI